MTEHAKLSASGAHRWMLCPGSVKAEETIPEQSNKYADEGTKAHNIAANKLNSMFYGQATDDTYYGDELETTTNKYVEYIRDIYNDKNLSYISLFIEKKVEFPNIVPDGFGTPDCVLLTKTEHDYLSNNVLHVVDFKYGLNRIDAKDNMQLLLYAIGANHQYDFIEEDFQSYNVVMHIVQPRINNYSTWELSIYELYAYYKYINHKALEALKDNAPRIPSEEACRWCKARFTCYALKNVTKDVVDLSNKQDLTDSDIRYVLDNAKLVKSFISSLEQRIYEQIESGGQFEGYKLVDGRSTRKLREDAQEKLVALLGEKAYSKSIINITELDKLLTKDEVNSLVYLSKGKPRLVKDNGNNESIEFDSLIFESIE